MGQEGARAEEEHGFIPTLLLLELQCCTLKNDVLHQMPVPLVFLKKHCCSCWKLKCITSPHDWDRCKNRIYSWMNHSCAAQVRNHTSQCEQLFGSESGHHFGPHRNISKTTDVHGLTQNLLFVSHEVYRRPQPIPADTGRDKQPITLTPVGISPNNLLTCMSGLWEEARTHTDTGRTERFWSWWV